MSTDEIISVKPTTGNTTGERGQRPNVVKGLLRYVDNRLCLVDPSWHYEPAFANFLHPEFYGKPTILETEPDQELLGFCIEFERFALRYSPPRDFNQVMAPFSASPLDVQLYDFVSRLFLVAKCAYPQSEQLRGFAALHRLYKAAGFQEPDLVLASKPIRRYLHIIRFGKTLHQVAASEPSQTWNLEQLRSILPSTGVWNQPPGFLPDLDYSDETNAFIDGAPSLPSPDLEAEEKFMQELVD